MNFYKFMEQHDPDDFFAIDFREDALLDSKFPLKAKTKKQILDYLEGRFACAEALEGFEALWQDYIQLQPSLK